MAAPKLTPEQQDALRVWLTAEYHGGIIRTWFAERQWGSLADSTLNYYRNKWRDELDAARVARRDAALATGLALKAERVQRLIEHADALESFKWDSDDKGRLLNEKAWRETLDDIAKEMGHRRQGVDVALEQELGHILDRLRDNLSPEEYAKALAALARETAS